MRDFTWKIFSQTGNIETYLLLKEMETNPEDAMNREHNEQFAEIDNQV
ncbi:YqzL family protein [Pontibacillus salicampi]|uniref:YqzL family protein n=1 Tax=Pontibacillus salicampi TaxID=1449801 RepID=A0ABV6LJQ1_9BACI